MKDKMQLTDEEWKKKLTSEQYKILRQKDTERPFSGELDQFFKEGKYTCAGCSEALFYSESKFNSGCGWPAFDKPVSSSAVEYKKDSKFGMERIEILCNHCGGHLGHVFNDGPTETGERFCVNSLSLNFEETKS